jgi:hypothetical protein
LHMQPYCVQSATCSRTACKVPHAATHHDKVYVARRLLCRLATMSARCTAGRPCRTPMMAARAVLKVLLQQCLLRALLSPQVASAVQEAGACPAAKGCSCKISAPAEGPPLWAALPPWNPSELSAHTCWHATAMADARQMGQLVRAHRICSGFRVSRRNRDHGALPAAAGCTLPWLRLHGCMAVG